MRNWKIPPKNLSVAKYVDCYWLLEKSQGDLAPEHPKLNPDPAGHLILSESQQRYQYEHESLSAVGHGSHLILPHCKTISIDHTQPFLIVGIKFHVGALYSLKLPTAQPLLDQVISINTKELFQVEKFSIAKVLAQAINRAELCRDTLDELLIRYLLDSHEDRHSNLVRNALAIPSSTSISKMGAELGCSQRTVERGFLRVTGLTLKQYHSMERLDAMLNHLHTLEEKHISWANIAHQFGFSDQPHLIRYLKSNIGNTPGEYLKLRDLVIDAYGNFE
jgi:AraC-like DNA-binding protein